MGVICARPGRSGGEQEAPGWGGNLVRVGRTVLTLAQRLSFAEAWATIAAQSGGGYLWVRLSGCTQRARIKQEGLTLPCSSLLPVARRYSISRGIRGRWCKQGCVRLGSAWRGGAGLQDQKRGEGVRCYAQVVRAISRRSV